MPFFVAFVIFVVKLILIQERLIVFLIRMIRRHDE